MEINPIFQDGFVDIAVKTMILQGYMMGDMLAYLLTEDYEIVLGDLTKFIELLSADEEFPEVDAGTDEFMIADAGTYRW